MIFIYVNRKIKNATNSILYTFSKGLPFSSHVHFYIFMDPFINWSYTAVYWHALILKKWNRRQNKTEQNISLIFILFTPIFPSGYFIKPLKIWSTYTFCTSSLLFSSPSRERIIMSSPVFLPLHTISLSILFYICTLAFFKSLCQTPKILHYIVP